MKDHEAKEVKLTEVGKNGSDDKAMSSRDKIQKIKKPLIFVLMAVVFMGCMYLIFKPSSKKEDQEKQGLNEAVPQATDAGMQSDKGKAYEADLLEQKDQESKNSLTVLSDYWNADSTIAQKTDVSGTSLQGSSELKNQNEALSSYRSIQNTLGTFYEDKGEATQLRNEIKSLKAELAQREILPQNPVENQLALMEKSYEMAAKYFPPNTGRTEEKVYKNNNDSISKAKQQEAIADVLGTQKNIVSALYREPTDSALVAGLLRMDGRNFFNAGKNTRYKLTANSIRACIHETQTVIGENTIRLRLLEPMRIGKMDVPAGTVITAIAKFQGVRLQLLIKSVGYRGNIVPVEIMVYDQDGQVGLTVPFSPERSAVTEMLANMGNTSGTNVSLSSSAGQQITSDLSKSLVQGISGYFSKKVRAPKITLKAGYQVLLVTKNNV